MQYLPKNKMERTKSVNVQSQCAAWQKDGANLSKLFVERCCRILPLIT